MCHENTLISIRFVLREFHDARFRVRPLHGNLRLGSDLNDSLTIQFDMISGFNILTLHKRNLGIV